MSDSMERRIRSVSRLVKSDDSAAEARARLMEILAHPIAPGGQWPELFTLLVGEFDLPVEGTRRGKSACHALVAIARRNAETDIGNTHRTEPLGPVSVAQTRIELLKYVQSRFDQWEAEVARILAEQGNAPLATFSLEIRTAGTGSGTVTRSRESEAYIAGSTIALSANADSGSVFNGWQGDLSPQGAICTVTMDSAKVITATFDKLGIPDLGIGVVFDRTEDASTVNGDGVLILHLTISNNTKRQVQVEVLLSGYTPRNAEEIEQSAWLSGAATDSKAYAIRAGASRGMGLVFVKSELSGISWGDHLNVTVIQKKPSRRLHFTFKCTHQKSRSFALVDATAEDIPESTEMIALPEVLRRLALLEAGLSEVRAKLDRLLTAPSPSVVKVVNRRPPENTLKEVVAWLATQDRIAVATLRIHLLPLDLLPTAIIDKLNEHALDLTGELALEELGDEIVVSREILVEVLANWVAVEN